MRRVDLDVSRTSVVAAAARFQLIGRANIVVKVKKSRAGKSSSSSSRGTTEGGRRTSRASRPTSVKASSAGRTPGAARRNFIVFLSLVGLLSFTSVLLLALSPAERQVCLDRLAKAPSGGPIALNLDRHGDAAGKDQEPYLARKPRNGCKIGAGGDTTPSGVQGVAAGVGCALSF